MRISDWSSDVCSSDLVVGEPDPGQQLVDLLFAAGLVAADAGLAADAQWQGDILARSQVVEQAEVLEHDPYAPPQQGGLPAREAGHVAPEQRQDRKSTRLNSSH